MLAIVLMMLGGILVGFLLKKINFKWISNLITVLIWLLLFVLGIEVGSNESIINNLGTLGLEALLLATAATLGSVTMASLLWKKASRKMEEKGGATSSVNKEDIRNGVKGSLVIVGFFAVGTVVGITGLLSSLPVPLDKISTTVLFLLMFCVGISIGSDENTLRSFKTINPVLALLPVMTILGTWIGSALCALPLGERSVSDCLAVGSGLGYYSLSSVLITEAKGADLGTIALLSNIIREIYALVCAPLFLRFFGRLAPISAGGCTTADTTLPIVTSTCGKEFAVVSIYHGFTTDFTVPFIVSLFCMF